MLWKSSFDTLAATANTAVLLQLTLGLLLVAVSQWVFAIARNFAEQRLSGISTIKLEMGLWGRILNLPVSYFRKASAGELLNWYQSIVAVVAAVNQYTISAMFSVIYAFFYFIQMTTFSFYLTLVGLLGFVVSILIFVSCFASPIPNTQTIYRPKRKDSGLCDSNDFRFAKNSDSWCGEPFFLNFGQSSLCKTKQAFFKF